MKIFWSEESEHVPVAVSGRFFVRVSFAGGFFVAGDAKMRKKNADREEEKLEAARRKVDSYQNKTGR